MFNTMKQKLLCFIICIIAISHLGFASKITNPENIGKQVFKILKDFEKNKQVGFSQNFITIKEIWELANNKDVIKSEMSRKQMASMEYKFWNDRIDSRYERIKENGKKYNIRWDEIEYSDFLYCIKFEDGIRGCKGDLSFKHKDNFFEINVSYVFDGKEFKLVNIEGLKKL